MTGYDEKLEQELIKEIPKALLNWYCFKEGSRILYIGTEDSYAEVLSGYACQLVYAACEELRKEQWQESYGAYFDYVVCIGILEQEPDIEGLLKIIRRSLRPGGSFLSGFNNRMAARYFCGDRDPYTGRSFDGVEGYKRAYAKEEDLFYGRMYSREELRRMLCGAGWRAGEFRFFSVLMDLRNPYMLYSEDFIPNEDLATRIHPTYNYPDTVFLEEEQLYQSLIENGMFHQMANAYLVECSMDGRLSEVSCVTGSMDRGRDAALLTVIHRSGTVEKRAVYPEGRKRLEQLVLNGEELKARGISVVNAKLAGGVYQMPYIEAEGGQLYLNRLLRKDKNEFLKKLDHFRDLILQSSEIVKPDLGDGEGAVLKKGYLEMMPLNSFYLDGEFLFFDQEIAEYDCPANLVIFRMIASLYSGNAELLKYMPMEELYGRYGLTKYLSRWRKLEWEYLEKLLNKRALNFYYKRCRRNPEVVHANRQRMNYSEMDYQRLFVDIFKRTRGRRLILFGSGVFAKQFIGMFGKDYPVYAVVDNNESRWGQEIEGVKIQPPSLLKEFPEDGYKVIVCIKNFLSVVRQLDAMGIKNYSIFDSGKSYPRPERRVALDKNYENGSASIKKYQIGYAAGVFDMFHIGHVNLLRRAKEQCDHLVVGVVPDKDVYRQKQKYPVIPCKDRIEILRACRYVDEAEELPDDYTGIRDAYKKFHFDCMFSGDDHAEDPRWVADKEFLDKNGVDIVFFKYTEKVSSTKLREQLADGGAEN